MAFKAELFREKMKACGVSQKQLAEKTPFDVRSISRWANGHQVPKLASILKLAEALGCSPRDFDPDFADSMEGVIVSGRVSAASHNAYAAMKLVFNVSQTQILELAPILFATVAARALQIPGDDDAFFAVHECEARNRGIRIERTGHPDESDGLNLDREAANNHKCFGLEPENGSSAISRNLFWEALRRMVGQADDRVSIDMWQQDWPGHVPDADGFNPHVPLLDLVAEGDPEIIRRLVRGEVRLSTSIDKAEIANKGALGQLAELIRKDLAEQAAAHRAMLEAQRRASQARLDQWRQGYELENPEWAQEYEDLAAALCHPAGWYPAHYSDKKIEEARANPFAEARFIDRARYPGRFALFGHEPEPVYPCTKGGVERFKELQAHRAASKSAFEGGSQ
ncbi:helix-turn-helix domain-containing protein [Sphingobium yanoikuyae]|uniref:helix-turn-helix domain-containing protein n=1 Tax=Sphingobium yanoikuyae TaxID=13690 RepID=UPI000262BFD0|nr:helix-turn-helix transcriptional regulator [Sphingobium yanoikuyae]